MVSHIIARGQSIPCAADVRLWADTGLHFTANGRRTETRAVVWHWTAAENPPTAMFKNLVSRGLSVHFCIDQLGVIWQMMDADVFGAHAGGVNGWTIGVEMVNRAWGDDKRWPRETTLETIHGKTATTTKFYPAQIEAAKALGAALSAAYGLPMAVPTAESGEVIARRMTPKELGAFRGHMCHFHAHDTKRDAGLDLLNAFRAAWSNY